MRIGEFLSSDVPHLLIFGMGGEPKVLAHVLSKATLIAEDESLSCLEYVPLHSRYLALKRIAAFVAYESAFR
jgi:hypothetical protein